MGLALVQTFYERGYQVYAVVRTTCAYDMLTTLYPAVSVLITDVTHENYEEQLFGFIQDRAVDIVINNAGSAGTPG